MMWMKADNTSTTAAKNLAKKEPNVIMLMLTTLSLNLMKNTSKRMIKKKNCAQILPEAWYLRGRLRNRVNKTAAA